MKQHFLQLAYDYDDGVCNDWWLTEKFDGQRAFWDGGISRGRPISTVPYANTSKDRHTNYLATGLWSRYGKVIHAPDWFLDQMPEFAVDGELWGGYDKFQQTTGVVRSKQKDQRWYWLKYLIFDVVPMRIFLEPRFIDIPTATFSILPCDFEYISIDDIPFDRRVNYLVKIEGTKNVKVVYPIQCQGKADLFDFTDNIIRRGGEGAMLRSPTDHWKPERCHTLLKYKPIFYGEGTVTGYTEGLGKYLGKIGALIIESPEHGQFKLSGITDYQRTPGVIPIGSTVRYKYQGLTLDHKPRNARYDR